MVGPGEAGGSVSEHAPRRRRKLGIATQVLIGLGVGAGIVFGEGVAFLK